MYAIGPTNYGLYGLFVTASVLSVLALTAPDPMAIAIARWIDTLAGCAIALAVAFIVPAWNVLQLPTGVAACCQAMAERYACLSATIRARPTDRDLARLRASGITTREAISDALVTVRVSALEPARDVPVAQLQATRDAVRQMRQARRPRRGAARPGRGSIRGSRRDRCLVGARGRRRCAATATMVPRAPRSVEPAGMGTSLDQTVLHAYEHALRALALTSGTGPGPGKSGRRPTA